MYFELTVAELLTVQAATRADVNEARQYSTPRNPQFSDFDEAMFVDALTNKSELLQHLRSDPESAQSLARLLAGHNEALSSRMQEYATTRTNEIDNARRIHRYELQRGATT